jgi:hypothetical protein
MREPVLIHAMPHPLRPEILTAEVEEGATLEEMLGANAGPTVHAWVGGTRVDRACWKHVRPKAGAVVTVKVLAAGGGGGGDKTARTVLQIAVMAAAIAVTGPAGAATGWAAFGYYTAAAAISVVGSLAINALIPPQIPSAPTGGNSFDRLRAVTGTRNQVNAFGAVPRVYGRHRIFPPFAAKPYTEVVGKNQYLRILLCLGYGPLTVTDLKIGETPIENFDDVEHEITSSPSDLYSRDIVEEAVSVSIDSNGEEFTRVTAPNTSEFSFDVLFPEGLLARNIDGEDDDTTSQRLKLDVQYRAAGSSDPWINVSTLPDLTASGNGDVRIQDSYRPNKYGPGIEGNRALWSVYPDGQLVIEARKRNPFRTGLRWAFPNAAQWEIRIARTERGALGYDLNTGAFWTTSVGLWNAAKSTFIITTVRSILASTVPFQSNFVYIAMRIRATGQLNGVIDTVNCVAESHLNVWDGNDLVLEPSRSPAWAYLDALTGSATERALDPETRVLLDDLKDWADECEAAGRTFDYIFDSRTTVFEAIKDIAAVGRASPDVSNGKYSIIRDRAGLPPVQVFTPRNSWGFAGERRFHELPHAMRMRFINPAKGWQQDERTVYDDGYGPANATRFETVELRGVTDPDQAWRDGRYILATARLRPETFVINADVENLVCRRGDVVRLVHDTIATSAWGRLKDVVGATLTRDEPVTRAAGGLYGIRIRKADGTVVLKNVITAAGTSDAVTLSSSETGIAADDLWVFGNLDSESQLCKVLRIRALENLAAQLELVPEDPAIYMADAAAPPPFESDIPDPIDTRPRAPTIYHIASDESVLLQASDGSLTTRIVVFFGFPSAALPAASTVETEYRLVDDTLWNPGPTVGADAGEVSLLPVDDGSPYEIRMRTVADGEPGAWSDVFTHTVVGKTTPPPDVEALFINGQALTWSYPSEPLDFKGFVVRYHAGLNPSWDSAIPAHPGVIAGPPFSMADMPGGNVTILVKGVDSSNLESVNAAIISIDLGDTPTDNIVAREDFAAAGFPGTKTNCTVSGDDLVADTQSLAWSGNNDAPAWTGNDAALVWTASYTEMTYEASYAPPGDMTGTDTTMILAPVVQGAAWSVEYRTRGSVSVWSPYDTDPAWSGDDNALAWAGDGPWRAWPGALVNVQRETFDFRLSVAGGAVQGILDEFTVITDVPDVRETLNDVPIGLTGTRLPIAKTYRAIKNVAVLIQDASADAIVVKRVDLSTAGPMLQAYTAAGAATTAIVDARIEGY